MRGKGEGSIYRRASDGLWVATLELPPHAGQRRRRVVTGKTKRLVLQKVKDERARLEHTGDLPTASQTVEQWCDYWLREIAAKEVRPKTLANYRSVVARHVLPEIGTVRLSALAPLHVRRVAAAIEDAGLSSTTALTVHRIMSSAFSQAEREGRITRNPAKLVSAPRREVPALEVLTTDEVRRFVTAYGQSPEAYLWITYMLTGMRRGELLGLQWDRVTDHLDLAWQLQRHPVDLIAPKDYEYQRLEGGLYLTRPKSKAGWRLVPLVEPLAPILDRWREIAPPNKHNLVFARPDGRPFDPDAITREWPRVLAATGSGKHVRLHDLRHTTVDLLYEAGVPEDLISEIVGHSNRTVTRGYKSRGNRPQLTKAMRQMSALLTTPDAGTPAGSQG